MSRGTSRWYRQPPGNDHGNAQGSPRTGRKLEPEAMTMLNSGNGLRGAANRLALSNDQETS